MTKTGTGIIPLEFLPVNAARQGTGHGGPGDDLYAFRAAAIDLDTAPLQVVCHGVVAREPLIRLSMSSQRAAGDVDLFPQEGAPAEKWPDTELVSNKRSQLYFNREYAHSAAAIEYMCDLVLLTSSVSGVFSTRHDSTYAF
jgi:hypothetical protein